MNKKASIAKMGVLLLCVALGAAWMMWDVMGGAARHMTVVKDADIASVTPLPSEETSNGGDFVMIDRPVPEFRLRNLQGEDVFVDAAASDMKGAQATIYHFWASWCAPCIIELPELLTHARENTANIRYVLISVDEDVEAISRFQARLKRAGGADELPDGASNVLWLHDPQKKVMEGLFGTRKLPESYISDHQARRLAAHAKGSAKWDMLDLSDFID